MAVPSTPGAETDTVLGKVVAVLFAFTANDQQLSLAELGRRTGLAKATAHRVVSDLVRARMLERTTNGYRLGGRVFELGMRASVERRLLEVATPFMEELRERTRETVHLGLLEGREVVYVAKIGGHGQAPSPSRLGGRMPLHCTAIGKTLLAHSPPQLLRDVVAGGLERRTPRTLVAPGLLRRQLDRVIESGVAFEYEESAVGIVCLAAPVLDAEGRPVAAISVTGRVGRFEPERHAGAVRAAADGVAAILARRASLGHG